MARNGTISLNNSNKDTKNMPICSFIIGIGFLKKETISLSEFMTFGLDQILVRLFFEAIDQIKINKTPAKIGKGIIKVPAALYESSIKKINKTACIIIAKIIILSCISILERK
jgi:hypothetical protein